MEKVMWEEMTSPEIEKRIKKGNGLAIIPLGSVEMHGPHLPVGCDSFTAQAFSKLLAKRVGALVLPTIKYTWPGFTRNYPGTIRIKQEVVKLYVEPIVHSLVKENGIKRILLVSMHGGNRWWAPAFVREFFEETGVPILFTFPWATFSDEPDLSSIFAGKDGSYKEASLLLASLKILGKQEIVNLEYIKEDEKIEPIAEFERVSRYGTIGANAKTLSHHVAMRKGVTAEKGLRYLEILVEKFAHLIEDLKSYEEYLKK